MSRSRSVARGPGAQGGASAETRVARQALQGHRAEGESAAALPVQSLRKGPWKPSGPAGTSAAAIPLVTALCKPCMEEETRVAPKMSTDTSLY